MDKVKLFVSYILDMDLHHFKIPGDIKIGHMKAQEKMLNTHAQELFDLHQLIEAQDKRIKELEAHLSKSPAERHPEIKS